MIEGPSRAGQSVLEPSERDSTRTEGADAATPAHVGAAASTEGTRDRVQPDMPGVNRDIVGRIVALRGSSLKGLDWSEEELQGANLASAVMSGINLRCARLQGANLRGARLKQANLRGADLRRVDFTGANLHGADLRDADLRGANFWGALLWDVRLEGANLQDAQIEHSCHNR